MRLPKQKHTALLSAMAVMVHCSPALAGWKLMSANQTVTVDEVRLTPSRDWNQASSRPGKQGRAWTQDGFGLNAIEFFGGVPDGAPLYRERSAKHDPMPKFNSAMLAPELVDFFERSFRVRNQITDFSVDEIKVVDFGGHQGVALSYSYSLPNDELKRRGIARLAVAGKRLFVANFYAPRIHYFPSALPEVEALMDSARF